MSDAKRSFQRLLGCWLHPSRHALAMQRTPVNSTAIASAGYDEATEELELEFQSGRIYRYRGVPAGVYQFLLRAPSKGGYHNRMIEGRYPYEDVTPSEPEVDLLSSLQASLSALGPKD